MRMPAGPPACPVLVLVVLMPALWKKWNGRKRRHDTRISPDTEESFQNVIGNEIDE